MNQMHNENGKQYWRSLGQLQDTPEFREFLDREFPQGASEFGNDWSRRSFLTLMGASVALAGLAGCRKPVEKIVPYVTRPEGVDPGESRLYATTMPFGIGGYGVLATSRDGRPIKVDGNPEHPSTPGGGSTPWLQASILNLYDPDRARQVMNQNVASSWSAFASFWSGQHKSLASTGGEGLAVLTDPFGSPTLARLMGEFKKTFPKARFVSYEPVSDEQVFEGIRLATGTLHQPVYSLEKAKIVLSLNNDFVRTESDAVRNQKGFMDGRRVYGKQDAMNRLYVVEPAYTLTGMLADHRLRVASSQILDFLLLLAAELGIRTINATPEASFDAKWIRVLAGDLQSARGASIIMVGRNQPPIVHALAFEINRQLNNIGNTVTYNPLQDASPSDTRALAELTTAMNAGEVTTLVVLGANPVYHAPTDLNFEAALKKVKLTIAAGTHVDETAEAVQWHLPISHYLEQWGDVRTSDGTVSLIQPLIEPLYATKSNVELLALVATGEEKKGYDIVRETWSGMIGGLDAEGQWRRTLHDGVLKDSAVAPAVLNAMPPATSAAQFDAAYADVRARQAKGDAFELVFTISNVWDGRYANNGWLQELADPITKTTWENVAAVSPKAAQRLGVVNGDIVELNLDGKKVEMAVWVNPGQAEATVSVALGYGRNSMGRVAENVGVNTYLLRASTSPFFAAGLTVTRTGRNHELAQTQEEGSMHGRPIIREATLEQYKAGEDFKPEQPHHPPLVSMWDEHQYTEGYQWGMSIDLNACTGCNACAMACQSENNIPIVGRDQVRRGREMLWIRLDRYFAGDLEDPEIVMQPVMCQHCENAPCESVCPVAATVHDHEGLNTMVYNRCIGTRYCSNNCPYKVRRFNFFNYTKNMPESLKMVQNPEVTVRFRGVMEKCTYCIQRIQSGKIAAKLEGRSVRDGEIQTACQQACPTQAIVFGNILDKDAQVTQLKKGDRKYEVLAELNTRPRTSYLAKLRNPNPELATTTALESEHNS